MKKKKKIAVLGAGLVGAPMAMDLALDPGLDITVVDIDESALDHLRETHPGIKRVHKDLANKTAVTKLVGAFDIVLNAVPGFMGFDTLKAIVKAKRNVVDISFFPEDPFDLNRLAREKAVTTRQMSAAPAIRTKPSRESSAFPSRIR